MFHKMKSKGHKIAMAVGLFFAALHALWAGIVALGVGQVVLDWVLPLHFIDELYTVLAFNFVNALLLIVMAFVGGYLAAALFLAIWKWMKIK